MQTGIRAKSEQSMQEEMFCIWEGKPAPCTLPPFRYPTRHHCPFKALSLNPAFGIPRFTPKTVKELLSHSDVKTTMIYTHVLNRGGQGVRSPADGLMGANPWQV